MAALGENKRVLLRPRSVALCYDGPGSLRQTQGRAVLGCEGLWSQGEVGQAARVKPCGDGQGQGDSCHCSLGLKGPPWGSGDPGHWGQLVSKAPFRPSWAPSCVSGNQAWPLPWMLGPRGESPAQGPCRSCDFLRAGRLQKLLWMWSGVQSVPGPWSPSPVS